MKREILPEFRLDGEKLGVSQRDIDSYAAYQKWCKALGITAAKQETYLRMTSFQSGIIAWSAAK